MLGRRLACVRSRSAWGCRASRARAGESPASAWAPTGPRRPTTWGTLLTRPSPRLRRRPRRDPAGRAGVAGAKGRGERMRKRPSTRPRARGREGAPLPTEGGQGGGRRPGRPRRPRDAGARAAAAGLGASSTRCPSGRSAAVADLLAGVTATGPRGSARSSPTDRRLRLPRTAFALIEDAADARREIVKAQGSVRSRRAARRGHQEAQRRRRSLPEGGPREGDDSGWCRRASWARCPISRRDSRPSSPPRRRHRRRRPAPPSPATPARQLAGLVAADADRVSTCSRRGSAQRGRRRPRLRAARALARAPARAPSASSPRPPTAGPGDAAAAVDACGARRPRSSRVQARRDDGADWRCARARPQRSGARAARPRCAASTR
jgi:hypothetical protein